MKLLLLFPPSWTPSMPHLATPTLTAYLRSQGVDAVQRDLNIEVMDHILTRQHLTRSLRLLRHRYKTRSARRRLHASRPPRDAIDWALGSGPQLASSVERGKRVFRSDDYWEGGRAALQTISASLHLVSLAYYPSQLELSAYSAPVREDMSVALLEMIADPHRNLFYDALNGDIIDSIVASNPDIVGISIPTMAQLVAALTIAHLLKKRGCTSHITIGGPHVTMLRAQIARLPALFELVDSAIVFEGERPLLALVEALSSGRDLSTVPNLIARQDERIMATPRVEPIPLSKLPNPTFDGLPLSKYLTPELVLPLSTSRGCYHGRCAFCSAGYGEPHRFEQLSPERVVESMTELRAQYGVRHVFFSDEAVTPRNLRGIARLMEQAGKDIHWAAYARMEPSLTDEILQGLPQGGCQMLLFGLESASPRVLKRMNKGTTPEEMSRVLRHSAQAGLWNHVFFFFGFPGETLGDAQETVNFLYAHADSIHSAAFGTFMLERHSPVHGDPKRFGITNVCAPKERDLAICFDYEVKEGMDSDMADTVMERLMDTLPDKPNPHLYVHDTYRLLYASRLQTLGQPFPTWLGG